MKIFYRRPLCLILCIMLGGFSVFAFMKSGFKFLLFIIPVLLLLLSLLKIKRLAEKRNIIRAGAAALLLSLLFSHIYFDLYYYSDKSYTDEVEIVGTITKITNGNYYSSLDIQTYSIDGKSTKSIKLLMNVKSVDVGYYPENAVVEFRCKLVGFQAENSSFDTSSYYYSRGYSAEIIDVTNFKITDRASPILEARFTRMRQDISRYMILKSDMKCGGLLAALLLGEKEYLDPQLALDFKRIGITHMLALSGLNLTILVIGFSKLLAMLGVSKKPRYIINIIVTIFYLALTGFPLSVVRAGVMLIITSMLFLLMRAHDSVTALVLSVFIICLVNPPSVFDLGLWLSAFATLGIVILSEIPKKKDKKHKLVVKLLIQVKNAFLVTAFAVSATFAITVFSFDEISAISPISTFLFSIPLEIYLYLAIILIVFGEIFPIGSVVTFIGEPIIKFAAFLSEIEICTVSSDFILIKILTVLFSVLFFSFLIMDIKPKRLCAAVLSIFMFSILALSMLLGSSVKSRERINYHGAYNGKSQESFLMVLDRETSVIDQASSSILSSYNMLSMLGDYKLTLVDNYIITGYGFNLPSMLEILLSNTSVRHIYLPKPKSANEYQVFDECRMLIIKFRTEIHMYTVDEELLFREFSYTLKYRKPFTSSGRLTLFEITHDNTTYSYASSGMLRADTKNVALESITQAENVIFGRHGLKYSNYNFAYLLKNAECIIFSSENMYIHESLIDEYEAIGVKTELSPQMHEFIH